MKCKQVTKSIVRRRRYSRLKKLKIAALSIGLMTAWGGTSAEAGTTYATTATATITVEGSLTFFGATSTLTITAAGENRSLGGPTGIFSGGKTTESSLTLDVDPSLSPGSGFMFAGAIDNGDGTSDLVLSFPGDGAIANGVVWTSLFVDNIPEEQRVFEPAVLQQMASPPVFDSRGLVEPGSQLFRLEAYYDDLLEEDYGDTATLIAFNGPGNTGVVVGTITSTPVPEPTALALLVTSAGILAAGGRRRE